MNDQSVHKYQRGSVMILSDPDQPDTGLGATSLVSLASFRVGAGIIFLCVDEKLLPIAQSIVLPEVVVGNFEQVDNFLKGKGVLVCGPGWFVGNSALLAKNLLDKLLLSKHPFVIDAAVIDLIASNDDLWSMLHEKCILTPHGGEAKRLLESRGEVNMSDLAKTTEATIIEKGSTTMIFCDDKSWKINKPNRKLAVAGSGDVLAGIIAGLWAQTPNSLAFDIAKQAVQLHSKAGQKLKFGALASELADILPTLKA
ncbi:NAD(P)H-hydrate dehydratase [Candidatus Saccharibacteria bacterium]|nr:NAD(P)H-hydrate dehydratase [Candidatus Saccharibacteria bacterium]